jgi:hypothetical protein
MKKHEKYLNSERFSGMSYTYGYLGIIYFHDARRVSRTGVILQPM